MKSAERPSQQVALWRPREQAAFLPAALEIVETPPSPVGRAIAATIIAFFVLALGWAFLGHVDIIATAPGRLIPAGEVKVIQPLDAGIVRAIHVEDGTQVRRGDVLVELDPTVAGADRERLTHDLIQAKLDAAEFSALKREIDLGKNQPEFVAPDGVPAGAAEIAKAATQARSREQFSKLASFDQLIRQKRAELDGVAATIAKLNATIPVMEERDKIRRDLLEQELGTKFNYLDAHEQLLNALHEREVQAQRMIEVTSAQKSVEQQRDQAKSNYAVDILVKLAESEQKVSGLTQELTKAERKASDTELRSPIDGTVQQLSIHTVGGVVTPAQPLMVIVPRDRELLVEATVSNSDVGFVHVGQEVEVKVETFTFTRYGLLQGRVVDLSPDTVTRGDPKRDTTSGAGDRDERQNSGSPAYVAKIRLDRSSMMIDGQEQALGPGMAVTAEIKTGQRTIIGYLLSPLVAYTSESLRER